MDPTSRYMNASAIRSDKMGFEGLTPADGKQGAIPWHLGESACRIAVEIDRPFVLGRHITEAAPLVWPAAWIGSF